MIAWLNDILLKGLFQLDSIFITGIEYFFRNEIVFSLTHWNGVIIAWHVNDFKIIQAFMW